MSKIKVCAYARVSTDTKDQENSFDNQKSYFQREISKNPKYKLIDIYADKGLTATNTNREEFLKMIHDAGIDIDMYAYNHDNQKKHEQLFLLSDREPKFERIFVKNTSRFARNIDIIDLLRKLRQKGVYVEFLDIHKSTENESDFVFIEMLLIFDENESRDRSRKVQFGKLEGAKKGVIHVNSRIFGYEIIDKYTLKIIPEEAEIIKYVYELYAEGLGIRRITQELNKKGYKTREGKEFSKSTINSMLKNEKYKGVLARNKYTTGTVFVNKVTTPVRKSKDKWIIHEDAIPAIVSEELWNKCQKVRKSKINYKKQVGFNTGISKYAGLIKCAKCNSNYTRNNDKGRVFYNCSLKKKKGIKYCDNINISEKYLNESIQDLCNGGFYADIIEDRDVYIYKMYEVSEKLIEKIKEGIDEDKLNLYQNDLKNKKEQKDKLADLYLSNRIDLDYFDKKNKQLDKKIKELEKSLHYILGGKKVIIEELKEIKEIIDKLKKLNVKEKYTEKEMLNEINSITITRHWDYHNKIVLTFDYKLITEMNDLIEKYI